MAAEILYIQALKIQSLHQAFHQEMIASEIKENKDTKDKKETEVNKMLVALIKAVEQKIASIDILMAMGNTPFYEVFKNEQIYFTDFLQILKKYSEKSFIEFEDILEELKLVDEYIDWKHRKKQFVVFEEKPDLDLALLAKDLGKIIIRELKLPSKTAHSAKDEIFFDEGLNVKIALTERMKTWISRLAMMLIENQEILNKEFFFDTEHGLMKAGRGLFYELFGALNRSIQHSSMDIITFNALKYTAVLLYRIGIAPHIVEVIDQVRFFLIAGKQLDVQDENKIREEWVKIDRGPSNTVPLLYSDFQYGDPNQSALSTCSTGSRIAKYHQAPRPKIVRKHILKICDQA